MIEKNEKRSDLKFVRGDPTMGAKQEKGFLKDVLVFKDLSADEVEQMEKVSSFETYRKGDVVFREGDAGDSLYVVMSGEVRIMRITRNGAEKLLTKLGPKTFFGEMSLLDGRPRSASAIANTKTELIKITKTDMDKLLSKDCLAAYKVIRAFARTLCYRLRKMNDELLELFQDPDKTINQIIEEKSEDYYLFVSGWFIETND